MKNKLLFIEKKCLFDSRKGMNIITINLFANCDYLKTKKSVDRTRMSKIFIIVTKSKTFGRTDKRTDVPMIQVHELFLFMLFFSDVIQMVSKTNLTLFERKLLQYNTYTIHFTIFVPVRCNITYRKFVVSLTHFSECTEILNFHFIVCDYAP